MTTNNFRLSAEYARFLEFAIDQGRCLTPFSLLDDDLPPMVRHYEFGLNSWPVFVSPAFVEDLTRCAVSIPLLLPKLIRAAFDSDPERIAAFYDVTVERAALVLDLMERTDVTASLITRSDTVLTEQGLKTLEINFGRIGGWQIQFLDRQYRKQAPLQEFIGSLDRCESRDILREFYLHMSEACDRLDRDPEAPMVWMFVFPDVFFRVAGDRTIIAMLEGFAAEDGRDLQVIFDRDMSATAVTDGVMTYAGRRVDMLLVGPRSVIVPPEVMEPYRASRLVWLGNPVVDLFDDKRNLALLYAYRDHPVFSEEERDAIRRFVPWSAVVTPSEVEYEGDRHDLRTLLLSRRDSFVVKFGRGARGEDVVVGRFAEHDAWVRMVDTALASERYVVQEYCESLMFRAQGGVDGACDVDFVWGIFAYGRTYGGVWIRMMRHEAGRDGVINSARGAQETIVYEVSR